MDSVVVRLDDFFFVAIPQPNQPPVLDGCPKQFVDCWLRTGHRLGSDGTKAIECARQETSDLWRLAPLDFAAVQHIYRLAVAKKGHRWRRWRIACKQRAQMRNGRFVTASKDGSNSRGPHRVLEG